MAEIKLTISNDRANDFKEKFLKAYPNTSGLTDLQHIKKYIIKELKKAYKIGEEIINIELFSTTNIDDLIS